MNTVIESWWQLVHDWHRADQRYFANKTAETKAEVEAAHAKVQEMFEEAYEASYIYPGSEECIA